jgi:hypothetical protein
MWMSGYLIPGKSPRFPLDRKQNGHHSRFKQDDEGENSHVKFESKLDCPTVY